MKLFFSAVLAVLAAPLGFLAQSSSGTGQENLPGVATLIVQLGLSAVFLWQWQSERKERALAQRQLTSFLEKFGPVLADAVATLRDLKAGLVRTVARVDMVPDRGDYQQATRRLERITDEMSEVLRFRKDEIDETRRRIR